MPKIDDMINNEIVGTTFGYSAVKPDVLESNEYTLVNLVVDVSGSVQSFKTELEETVKTVVDACRKSPRVENILIRLVVFNRQLSELSGFVPAISMDTNVTLSPMGGTALFDATYSAIGATVDYAKTLVGEHFMEVNAINFIVTDGEDNSSAMNVQAIKNKVEEIAQSEELDGNITTILVGVNDSSCKTYLDHFKDEAGLDQYISLGNATANSLAKLAGFISKSISSVSQSLATGGSVDLTW